MAENVDINRINRINRIESDENTNPNIDINSLYYIPNVNNPPTSDYPHTPEEAPAASFTQQSGYPPTPEEAPAASFTQQSGYPPTPEEAPAASFTQQSDYITSEMLNIYNNNLQIAASRRDRRRLLRRHNSIERNIIPTANNFYDITRIREIECSVNKNAKLYVTNECPICISHLDVLGSVTTPCGHQFCLGCFMTHAENKLLETGSSNCPICRSDILTYTHKPSSPSLTLHDS